jgi:hypothetical protein
VFDFAEDQPTQIEQTTQTISLIRNGINPKNVPMTAMISDPTVVTTMSAMITKMIVPIT